MSHCLPLSELKRLTSPYASELDKAEAARYWGEHGATKRQKAMSEVLRAFYESRGVDIDQPTVKTIRRTTLEEKDRQHEEWHRDLEQFLADR